MPFFASSSNLAKKAILESKDVHPNEQKRVDIFVNMTETASENLIENKDSKKKIMDIVHVTMPRAKMIELQTRDQCQSRLWYYERSKRLTASLFGRVMKRRHSIYPTSIIDAVIKKSPKKFSTPATLWGLENETVALEQYATQSLNEYQFVIKSGLVINPAWPWLGASPDGVVVEHGKAIGATEIKCPFKQRDMSIDDAIKMKEFCLTLNKNGKPSLKRNHNYYFQCQGVVNILQLQWIEFVVYTKKELFVERIECDAALWKDKMLPQLSEFYATYILNKL